MTEPSEPGHSDVAHQRRPGVLALAALGIVFGDIGTSPLYALRECLRHGAHQRVEPNAVLGILSLIFWALSLTISVKYVSYVLRADNQGEGGILAMTALATHGTDTRRGSPRVALMLGLFGAALLFGDGIITPAISVLSAVEGLSVAAPALEPAVIPLCVVILIALFSLQRRGTASVGALFGPMMLVWFSTLGLLGIRQLVERPEVLLALDPRYAIRFLLEGGPGAFLVIGSVFLVVTGGEALYADVGHFGKRPIRLAWFGLVLPALVTNYFGQGALLLSDPSAAESPFYRMAPEWALYPLVLLSTIATVIASQALISGAFSLTRQALMLGFLPRVRLEHTSARQIGQIYVPIVNWALMIAAVLIVLAFQNSSNLAAAYGVAVSLDMTITTLLAYVVARRLWGWSKLAALSVTLVFLGPEFTYLGANLAKITEGGWFPLVAGAVMFTLLTTWRRGRELMAKRFRELMLPLDDFFEVMRVEGSARVPGTAVFMTGNPQGTPPALLHNFTHNRVVHTSVILLTIVTEDVARVGDEGRLEIEELREGFHRVVAHYGFMESPDVPALLRQPGLDHYPLDYVTFFLGRETVLPTRSEDMALWRERLFAFLSRNAQTATSFFGLPPSQVVEIGAQIEL